MGVNVLDSSGYPDCRPEWLAAMQEVARLGTKAGVERRPVTIRAPLIRMSKAEIIRAGVALGIDYGLAHSCYDPRPRARPAAAATRASCAAAASRTPASKIRPATFEGYWRGSRGRRRSRAQEGRPELGGEEGAGGNNSWSPC